MKKRKREKFEIMDTDSTADCPICMDNIKSCINCTITECGHIFHTRCLMKNILYNGLGCPYCRTQMA